MKSVRRAVALFLVVIVLLWAVDSHGGTVGTGFTYQGRLLDSNKPADGRYDFQFSIYDANTGGTKVSGDVNIPGVAVTDGYFTAQIDFGSIFDGNDRWLEIGVRNEGSAAPYTAMMPRQQFTPTPYALYAKSGLPGPQGPIGPAGASPFVLIGNNAYYLPGNIGIGTATPTQKLDVTGNIRGSQLISTATSGTPPLVVSSNTVVPNLNAEMLNGLQATDIASPIKQIVRGVITIEGNPTNGEVSQSFSPSINPAKSVVSLNGPVLTNHYTGTFYTDRHACVASLSASSITIAVDYLGAFLTTVRVGYQIVEYK